MRRHFPQFFTTRRAAHQFLAQVRREQPDARLIRLRRSGSFWVGCLTTAQSLGGSWGGLMTKGRCRH